MEETFELRSYSFKKASIWAEHTNLNAHDSVLLKMGLQEPDNFICWGGDDVFYKLASDGSQALNCAQPVQEIWDCAKARLWLETCGKCHGSVCKKDLLRIPHMNLIDCERMVVVKAAQEMRWVALSYVWGVNLQTQDNGG
jgi:hypothetical protein